MGRELFGKGKENMIEQKNPSVYDYDACRALWQRVSPSEDPYPAAEEVGTQSGELSLPGAEGDPCCMGTEAVDSATATVPAVEVINLRDRYASAMRRSG